MPVVFVLQDEIVWSAVDAKPKTTRALRRLANIEAHHRVSLLVDHYEDDWSALWWVRADGSATIEPVGSQEGRVAVAGLTDAYPQYAAQPPPGPLIRVVVDHWSSWSAQDAAP